jgi:hypothetical protein
MVRSNLWRLRELFVHGICKTVQVVPNTGERADGIKDVDVTIESVDGIGEFLGEVKIVP